MVVHLKKGRFLIATYNKLNMKKFGPFKILRKFDSGNAYEIKSPGDMDISSIFNVVDLYEYQELDDDVFIPNYYIKKHIEEVEKILDQRFGKRTRGKSYFEYDGVFLKLRSFSLTKDLSKNLRVPSNTLL